MKTILQKIHFLHQLFKLEDLFVAASFVFIASCYAMGGLPRSDILRLTVAMLFCVLGLASINSLNQIFDVEIDRINKPNRPIPSNILTKKQVLLISFFLSLGAGLLTIYLGLTYFIIALVGLTIGLIYCIPQIYAKGNPIFSTMVTAIGYGILMFLVGWRVYKPISLVPLWVLVFLYLHEIIVGMAKDFSDVEGDQKEGVKTIPVIFGKKKGGLLCFSFYLLPFFFLLFLQWTEYLATNFLLLFITGLVFGGLIFGFCSLKEKKYNYFGYFFWVIGAIMVRIVLFFAYMPLD